MGIYRLADYCFLAVVDVYSLGGGFVVEFYAVDVVVVAGCCSCGGIGGCDACGIDGGVGGGRTAEEHVVAVAE